VNEAIRAALASITLSDMAAAVPRAFRDDTYPLPEAALHGAALPGFAEEPASPVV
jgi:hypothetical protein